MDFKSFYKTKPKEPYVEPSPAEPKRPASLPRAPSIKINTKGSGTPRPSISGPSGEGSTVTATPTTRKPSINISKPALDTPAASSAKRPLPDKDDSASSVAKRPKTETPTQPNSLAGHRRKSSIVTLKTSNPKRLALVLGQSSASPGGSARTSLPGMVKREPTPEGVQDSIVAKPVRKPLPSGGESVRKPLPTGGSSISPPPPPPPPPPKMTINTNPGAAPATGQAGPPPTPTPGSATGRPKIKIIRKPQPGASQSPPAP